MIGPDSVLYVMEKVQLIRDRLKTAQSRKKSYVDVRRRELEFQIDSVKVLWRSQSVEGATWEAKAAMKT